VTAPHARSRFERLAAHLGPRPRAAPALDESYWQNVRDLFTRDLTQEGLSELLQRETQDTFRFFTREVPLDDLRDRPFYQRWPRACWRTFLAMAYRLSPWRRILFAVAVPLLAAAWLGYAVHSVGADLVPAALLMALLQGSLRTLLVAGFRGEELVGKLNAHLCANIPANRLVTFFYGELDTESGALSYVNAGHNPPLLLRGRAAPCALPATGPALGILETPVFTAERARLDVGDRLFLYTDGVTEAENARDESYGEERLAEFLDRERGAAGQALVDGLVQDVLAFCGTTRTRDDMTLMCLSRMP
jgi:hypothetical protein